MTALPSPPHRRAAPPPLQVGALVRVVATSPDSVWKGLGSGICVGQTCVILEHRESLVHPYRVRSVDRNTVAHCTRACFAPGLPREAAERGGALVRIAWAPGELQLTPCSTPHAPPTSTPGQALLGRLATVVDGAPPRPTPETAHTSAPCPPHPLS